MRRLTSWMAAAVLVGGLATAAEAATIGIDVVKARWTDITTRGTDGVTELRNDGTFSDPEIRWGRPEGDEQSGYRFDGRATPFTTSENTDFVLGDFTHFNYVVGGTTLATARLDVVARLTLDGSPISGGPFFFSFVHDETRNRGPCATPGEVLCPDIVRVASVATGQSFAIDGKQYTLAFAGLQVNGTTVSKFITVENATNTAQLVGRFTVINNPVPAAGWLLVTALGGLGVAARRRRNSSGPSAG